MKKRLLALALCLVMATSLLPVTAAADDNPAVNWIVGIENGKTYCKEASFTINCPTGYSVDHVVVDKNLDGKYDQIVPVAGQYKISGYSGSIRILIFFEGVGIIYLDITINDDHTGIEDHICDNCGESVHTWQFSKPDSGTLKATCNSGCPIGTVTVTLTADSVTLPEGDPFNAQLTVTPNFKEAFPNARITGPKYVYFESGKPVEVTRDSFTPKAGQYQAQAYIDNLFGNEVAELRAFSTDDGTNQIGNHVDLWVDYTAADPKVTAQTGDDRPIEIMMGSIVVFSALAAAAFILDSKRKSHR